MLSEIIEDNECPNVLASVYVYVGMIVYSSATNQDVSRLRVRKGLTDVGIIHKGYKYESDLGKSVSCLSFIMTTVIYLVKDRCLLFQTAPKHEAAMR